MMWLLLGIMPPEQVEVLPGPPNVNLIPTPSTQIALSSRARGFRDTWGQAVFRWHEPTATPRFVRLPGVDPDLAEALVEDLARLARVDPHELQLSYVGEQGSQRILRFDRIINGAPVFQNHVALVVKSGRIGAAWVRLHPGTVTEPPLPGEEILVVDNQLVPAVRTQKDHVVRYVHRSGSVLAEWSERRYAQLHVQSNERTVGDPQVRWPAQGVTVDDGESIEVTNEEGEHGLPGAVTVTMSGPFLDIQGARQPAEATVGADGTVVGGRDITMAAATVHNHMNVVRDWLAVLRPYHPVLDETVTAQVNVGGACNAFYLGLKITFLSEDEDCNNYGEIADVTYHEMGHAIHDVGKVSGVYAWDLGEGSADFVAATINDEPTLGLNAWTNGDAIREIETSRVFPDDLTGEEHNDGLIWASFLWDLRTDWMVRYGAEAGRSMVEDRFLSALEQGPGLIDAYDALIVADDDDGNLVNGTPHGCELAERMNAHGIGPGAFGVLSFDHFPVGPQSSFAHDYEVAFELYDINADCSNFDPNTIRLWFTTDADLPVGAPPLTSETWGSWEAVPLDQQGTQYVGFIPRQFPGTAVRYVITGSSEDGEEYFASHEGAAPYAFWVGDREQLVCEDFEGEVEGWRSVSTLDDDWELGEVDPQATGGPTAATSGTQIYATNLHGPYIPYTQRRLISPEFDVSGHGDMLMLSYQRMLSVADGYIDRAAVSVNDEPVWENHASEDSLGAIHHHVDPGWGSHDVPLDGLVDDDGLVEFSWSLAGNTSFLSFFGWAIDDVCITQLIAKEEHHRVRDLAVHSGADAISLAWTQPFMEPFSATVLVRNPDGFAANPDDGEVIDLDLSPELGGAKQIDDRDLQVGEVWYYSLFAAGIDQEWIITGVVDGENAGVGQLPQAGDGGQSITPDDSQGEEKKGCSHGPGSAWWVMGLGMLALRTAQSWIRIG